MHAILITMGTDGDVIPFVGLGATLLSRGHRVTLAGPEPHEALALQHGLRFRSLVSRADADAFLNSPDLWHPIKSGLHGARWGAPLIRDQYEILADLASDDDAVLVSNAGIVAARLIQEKLNKPLATVLLQPGLLPSVYEPPVMPFAPIPTWLPRWMRHGYWRAVDLAGAMLIGNQLNRIRKSLGLSPVRRFFRWWLSPQLVIAMFPDWYAATQPDWPSQLRQVGFPQFDGAPSATLPDELISFCQSSAAPIAFTLGTGMMHGADFFRKAMETCDKLNRRGIFLTRHTAQLPKEIPSFIQHVSYAPFQVLFPKCSVVVHHGGIGTTARALAAGIPQVVLPLAWDQPDNAARIHRLGAGTSLSNQKRDVASLSASLTSQLTPEAQARCRDLSSRFGGNSAFEEAAFLLEKLSTCRGASFQLAITN